MKSTQGSVKTQILRELVRSGYAMDGVNKVWEINDPKFLYATSSLAEGFLTLQQYEVFRKKIIDIETDLIKKHAQLFVKSVDTKTFNFIDLGCGDGHNALTFLKAINGDFKVRYCPVDVNPVFVKKAGDLIKKSGLGNVVDIKPFVDDFSNLHDITGVLRNSSFQRNVIFVLGNTLAHYEINDFLFKLSRRTLPGDYVVIGNGIRTGERLVSLDKYKDDYFNQWLVRVMNEIGFKENELKYDARFANSRLECFYKLMVDKNFSVDGRALKLKKGDEIVVLILYKYYEKELAKFCKMYFNDVNVVKDKENEYALAFCKR